jgi:hypothetical protein
MPAKELILCFTLFLSFPSFSSTWSDLIGTKSHDTKLIAGSLFYHFRNLWDNDYANSHRGDHFRETLLFTYKGYGLGYLKNSHHQDSVVLGFERYWYQNKKENNWFSFGYRLGLIYGYCANFNNWDLYKICDKNFQATILPMGQAFVDYTYKRLGIEIAANPGFLNGSLIVRL